MKKIVLVGHMEGVGNSGDEITVSDDRADRWTKSGLARWPDESKPEPEPEPEPEQPKPKAKAKAKAK